MFAYCKSLVTAPEIPNNVTHCGSMFRDCSSLVNAPKEIPNGVFDCEHMFDGCKSLKEIPAIPYSVKNVYAMFKRCSDVIQSIGDIMIKNRGMTFEEAKAVYSMG